jgi:hypothetical protein
MPIIRILELSVLNSSFFTKSLFFFVFILHCSFSNAESSSKSKLVVLPESEVFQNEESCLKAPPYPNARFGRIVSGRINWAVIKVKGFAKPIFRSKKNQNEYLGQMQVEIKELLSEPFKNAAPLTKFLTKNKVVTINWQESLEQMSTNKNTKSMDLIVGLHPYISDEDKSKKQVWTSRSNCVLTATSKNIARVKKILTEEFAFEKSENDLQEFIRSQYSILCHKYSGRMKKGWCVDLAVSIDKSKYESSKQSMADNVVCKNSGGIWGAFSSGCHDECTLEEIESCTTAFTVGCHCQTGECTWNGQCIKFPDWHKTFDRHQIEMEFRNQKINKDGF